MLRTRQAGNFRSALQSTEERSVFIIWILLAGLGVDRVDIPDNRKAFLTPRT